MSGDLVCQVARLLILAGIVVAAIGSLLGHPDVAAAGGAITIGAGSYVHTFCSDHATAPAPGTP